MGNVPPAAPPPPPARRSGKEVMEEEGEQSHASDENESNEALTEYEFEDEEEERLLASRSPSSTPPPRLHPALAAFPDGAFVALRSLANRKHYVHADEDWVGVSLRPLGHGPVLNAVWLVHHWVADDNIFVQLQGAAYGRYLALSPAEAPPGHRLVAQRDIDPGLGWSSFKWEVGRVGILLDGDGRHDLLNLFNSDRNLALRANGSCCCARNNGAVTAGSKERRWITTTMQWMAEVVETSPAPIPLPLSLQATASSGDLVHGGRRGCCLLFQRRAEHGVQPHPPRTIYYARADDDGNFNRNRQEWPSFVFHDHSVFKLRTEVALRLDDLNGHCSSITLCAWPGSNMRLMPLFSDLPRSEEPMYIIVLTTGSPAAQALVYPQI